MMKVYRLFFGAVFYPKEKHEKWRVFTMNRVYVVEDDPVIAGAVAEHLKGWQMQCRCAENFEDIIGEMQRFQPDLVLLDIKLPYYNGFTGAARYGRCPGFRLCSSHRRMTT